VQLPASFIVDPERGVDLPQESEISIEVLETRFLDNLRDSIGGIIDVDDLGYKMKWAKNPEIFAKNRKGERVPGFSPFLLKPIKNIVNDLIKAGMLDQDNQETVYDALRLANNEVRKYAGEFSKRQKDALKTLEYASIQESVDYYNGLTDLESKKQALKNTRGYLQTGQFHMGRGDVIKVEQYARENPGDLFPEGQSTVFLQEIKIGAKYVVDMLEKAKEEIDNSVFEIISNVALLKNSLDQYFAGALKDDAKAQDAIDTSQKIEGKTEELRDDSGEETPNQTSLPL